MVLSHISLQKLLLNDACLSWTSLVAQTIKRLPTVRETWVRSLGQEDLLEKEMATHSSVLAWRIPETGSLVGCRLWGRTELDTTEET